MKYYYNIRELLLHLLLNLLMYLLCISCLIYFTNCKPASFYCTQMQCLAYCSSLILLVLLQQSKYKVGFIHLVLLQLRLILSIFSTPASKVSSPTLLTCYFYFSVLPIAASMLSQFAQSTSTAQIDKGMSAISSCSFHPLAIEGG